MKIYCYYYSLTNTAVKLAVNLTRKLYQFLLVTVKWLSTILKKSRLKDEQ